MEPRPSLSTRVVCNELERTPPAREHSKVLQQLKRPSSDPFVGIWHTFCAKRGSPQGIRSIDPKTKYIDIPLLRDFCRFLVDNRIALDPVVAVERLLRHEVSDLQCKDVLPQLLRLRDDPIFPTKAASEVAALEPEETKGVLPNKHCIGESSKTRASQQGVHIVGPPVDPLHAGDSRLSKEPVNTDTASHKIAAENKRWESILVPRSTNGRFAEHLTGQNGRLVEEQATCVENRRTNEVTYFYEHFDSVRPNQQHETSSNDDGNYGIHPSNHYPEESWEFNTDQDLTHDLRCVTTQILQFTTKVSLLLERIESQQQDHSGLVRNSAVNLQSGTRCNKVDPLHSNPLWAVQKEGLHRTSSPRQAKRELEVNLNTSMDRARQKFRRAG